MKKGIVAIVGRANVGKSTLFNRIIGERVSIVEDVPGVTRDRIYAKASWLTKEFRIIDTGGIELKNADFREQIKTQAEIAIEEADVIIFVVNGREGLTSEDNFVARMLQKSGKPVLLAVNKIDDVAFRDNIYDFYSLGIGEPIPVSSAHGIGVGDLLDEVIRVLPDEEDEFEEDEIKVSIIGRPNVGKSSLVNALLGQERVIVSDVAGTTRDAIDTKFDDGNTHFTLIDTAGMRRKGKIDMPIERYSVMRSLRAVDRADVVLMVISAPEGVTEQDKKIAGYAHESGKGCIIVVNKWDLIEKDDKTSLRFTEDIRDELGFLQYAPVLYTSALTKQRVHRVVDLVKYVAEQQAMRVQTSVLNQLVMDAVSINPPPSHKGKQLKIYFMTQADIKPPKFLVFVNDPELMHFSYLRFLENKLRESFGFEGTPLKLVVRGRKEEDDE